MLRKLPLLLTIALSGCAGISIHPIDPATGKYYTNRDEGLRFYMPKPYLLVAEVPVDKQPGAAAAGGGAAGAGAGAAAGTSSDGSKDSSGDSPSPTSDTSFGMATQQYSIKLVYLPDMSQPMAMSMSPGLFGTAEMKPTLQDGWMLTSLDATGDSKVSETLSALGSIIGAATGSSASGSTKSAGGGGAGGGGAAPKSPVLPPGLYELVYQNGTLTDVSPVAVFCAGGPVKGSKCP